MLTVLLLAAIVVLVFVISALLCLVKLILMVQRINFALNPQRDPDPEPDPQPERETRHFDIPRANDDAWHASLWNGLN